MWYLKKNKNKKNTQPKEWNKTWLLCWVVAPYATHLILSTESVQLSLYVVVTVQILGMSPAIIYKSLTIESNLGHAFYQTHRFSLFHIVSAGGITYYTHLPAVPEGQRQCKAWSEDTAVSIVHTSSYSMWKWLDLFLNCSQYYFGKFVILTHAWAGSVCNLVLFLWLHNNQHHLLKQSMVSEHGLRMESCEENSKCLWENKTRVLWPQFLQNRELFLESVFILLQGMADRNSLLQISHYCLLLLIN